MVPCPPAGRGGKYCGGWGRRSGLVFVSAITATLPACLPHCSSICGSGSPAPAAQAGSLCPCLRHIHHAGYFHLNVFCHHWPGDPLLHHLPALGALNSSAGEGCCPAASHPASQSGGQQQPPLCQSRQETELTLCKQPCFPSSWREENPKKSSHCTVQMSRLVNAHDRMSEL
ncbi:hypothetical protein G0U57_006532 [Chelydra serpentina]|uniref:Uncharacterized protein n=1 Tax=Chelydra serpentina TaxID=8475 RepID=A0A8T1TCD7_CHESE|nr:hypothetical protein G0U57_006532 [Chelydra serpentina]